MSPTHLLGESCVSKTGFCARIRGSTAPFGVNAAPSSRLAGSSAPLWGFLWYPHPTGLSQEGCGTSVLRRKGTTLFPCSPRQRKEHGAPQHVAQSKPEEHAKKNGKNVTFGLQKWRRQRPHQLQQGPDPAGAEGVLASPGDAGQGANDINPTCSAQNTHPNLFASDFEAARDTCQ